MTRATWHLRVHALVAAWLVAAVVATLVHRQVAASGWLMVHLLLLGAASTAILVWSQHFADTLLRRPAPGGRRGQVARLAAHTVGAVLVVTGVLAVRWPLTVAGGVLVAAGALGQTVVIVRQSRGALPSRFGPLVRYYVAAGAVLPLGVIAGVLLARGTAGDELHGRLSVAHLTLTLLGWVGLTVLGTLLVLWPTVLHAHIEPQDATAGARALPFALAGIALVALAALTGLRLLVGLGAAVVAVAVVLVVLMMVRQARTSPPRTYAGWTVGAATAWLLVDVVAFGALVVLAPDWASAAERVHVLVAPFAVGFVAQVLLGSLSYLMPVVLGGGPAVSRRTSAELDRGAVVRVVLVNGGLVLFVAPVPSAVRVLVSFVVLGALVAFLVLAARAVLAARRPAASSDTLPGSVPGSRTADVDGADRHVGTPPRAGAAVVAIAVLAAAVVGGVALDPPAAGLSTVAGATSAGAGVAATGETTTVSVEAGDMRFTPDRIEVPAGNRLVVEVTNTDSTVHDLVLATGASSGRLAPGESATVDVGVVTGDLDGWCSVAGHRLMGMTLAVVAVGEGTGAASGTVTADDHGMSGDHDMGGSPSTGGSSSTDGSASAAADVDMTADPAAGFRARDAALAPAEADGDGPTTHHVTLTVQEVEREVAPGVTQRLWTFGGQAPGPVLRGAVGDTFVVTLVNDGSIGHSIDFHAGALAPDDVMRTIAPGEKLTYTFTATRSGIWMYHCSTMPMSAHIANGMVGAVVIDPPGLPQVDREYLLVQSEYYLGPQGGEVDLDRLATQVPDLVTFNGYAWQYRHEPLAARTGERVRIWVLDAGPNRPSAFHVVGGQFDTVYREGDWVLRDGGSTGTGGSQVLALQPAEGGFVELTFPEAGTYSAVSHVMGDAEKGAGGSIVVTD